jgi:hypothetical protein
MTHLDLISAAIALAFAFTSAQSAIKTKTSQSTDGIHVSSIWLPIAVNAWFVYFYAAAGFYVASVCEVACVSAYVWWLIEYRKVTA